MASDVDLETAKLASEIEDAVTHHIAKFDEKEYGAILTSCVTAIAEQAGRLRYLCTLTDEVGDDRFDQLFWEAVIKGCDQRRLKLGEAEH